MKPQLSFPDTTYVKTPYKSIIALHVLDYLIDSIISMISLKRKLLLVSNFGKKKLYAYLLLDFVLTIEPYL